MESTVLGLVLDSSVLIAAERAKLTTPKLMRNLRASAGVGDAPVVISALTVAELAHGIYRANTPERGQQRRQFLDEIKAHIPIHPITSLYRLQTVTAADSSWGIGWTFDAWGNRLTQTPSGLATSKVGSQTLGYTNNRNTAFNYDNAGNQTSDASHNYTFNAVNQITQMDAGGAVYGYDGDGRRMKKTVGSETTYYFYAMGVLVSEFTTQNTGATAAASTDRTRYQTSDRLGTAVLIMDAAGLVVENNRTMPYGEEWLPAVASANEQKFTSYQRDGESGLDYAVARFFASTTGTLRSPDKGPMIPRLPATMNRYAYSLQDPINMTDPTGNVAQQVIRGLGCPSGIDYEIYIRYWEQVFSLKPTSASSHLRRLSIRTPQDRGAELEVAVP